MEVKDDWARPNGALGNGWIDAHQQHPSWWDALELVDHAPVLPQPDRGLICQPDNAAGRAAFYKDFGTGAAADIAVSIVWSGLRPLEATPLLHVDPDANEFGLGAWYFSHGRALLVGTIGRRPDQFNVIQAVPCDHVHGMHRRLELRSHGESFSVWISAHDVRMPVAAVNDAYRGHRGVTMNSDALMVKVGMDYPIPDSLAGATRHGGAIDVNNDWMRTGYSRVLLPPFRLSSL